MADKFVSVSLSGGKDSTAMLLMMLDKGEHIDEIVTVDTGMEFPEMYDHLEKLQKQVDIPFTVLKAEKSFEYYLKDHEIKRGKHAGQRGYGWARMRSRWCTSNLKTSLLDKHAAKLPGEVIQCVGIAADEQNRVRDKRYPLVEYGVTEAEALAYCYSRGFDWGGLYEVMGRVSCWCCPLQNLNELRALRRTHPELWRKLMELDDASPNSFRISKTKSGFKEISVRDLDARFAKEDARL